MTPGRCSRWRETWADKINHRWATLCYFMHGGLYIYKCYIWSNDDIQSFHIPCMTSGSSHGTQQAWSKADWCLVKASAPGMAQWTADLRPALHKNPTSVDYFSTYHQFHHNSIFNGVLMKFWMAPSKRQTLNLHCSMHSIRPMSSHNQIFTLCPFILRKPGRQMWCDSLKTFSYYHATWAHWISEFRIDISQLHSKLWNWFFPEAAYSHLGIAKHLAWNRW